MARTRGLFGPSEKALEFGKQYAEVLALWSEFFSASSKLAASNVRLGELAREASKEWDQWVRETANAPWNWMNPEVMRKMMGGALKPE